MFQIEKNIPLPTTNSARSKYPFAAMELYDSFAVPVETKAQVNSIRACASAFGKRTGRTFVVKFHGDEVRVWRSK